jgi:putative oxidoreductase
MNIFDRGSAAAVDTALAFVRIATAIIFIAHGAQKFFQIGVANITQGFTQMGIPMPGLTAPFITGLELVGGALLLVGLLTRPIALLLLFDMLGAMFLVHFRNGFFLPNGYEFTFILAATSLALAIAGPGALAVDPIIANRRRPRLAPAPAR